MTTRRNFFKQFIGEMMVLSDGIRGIDSIPLNRLKELPASIVERIEPILFPEKNWSLTSNVISSLVSNPAKCFSVELNETEFQAFGYFSCGMQLKEIAIEIKRASELPFEDIYNIVTSLFFKLATLRICHPKEVYNIDEILNEKKNKNE